MNQFRALAALLVSVSAVAPRTAAAGKDDSVARLLADGKVEAAQARCERWEAWDASEEPAIREACALAFLPSAQSVNTRAAWATFRQQWSGTDTASKARVNEAERALAEVADDASESVLVDLAELYRGTPSAPALQERAAQAAIRDASTGAEAKAVATRWASHPDLPRLVERFPDAFVTIQVDGKKATWTVDPPVPLTGPYTPTVRWVARWADGRTELWDETVRELLLTWGVPEPTVAQLPVGVEEPALPVCFAPGRPRGWGPGVELSVGEGRIFQPVGWDEGCGEDALPAFLSLERARVVGLSLRPGHAVDLRTTTLAGTNRRHTRGYLLDPPGTPMLWNGWIHERVGAAWMVTPLSGGTPWASATGPDAAAIPLSGALLTSELPDGWSVNNGQVRSATLDRMPPALRTWTLVPGQARTPPPLVREVIGLTASQAQPARPPAPPLNASGWNRSGSGAVLRTPPKGASIAGIYQLDEPSVAEALQAVSAVGLPASAVEVLDGWRADVDNDNVSERILRAVVDGQGATIIVDPLTDALSNPRGARVTLLETPRVRADSRPADTPFTFRRGQFVYFAWSGQEVLGPTARQTFVQVLRSDGAGYAMDDLTLP